MSEGPGQQPPQEPRNEASDGPREVLEGRVIPSRTSTSDPRPGFAGPPPAQDASSTARPGPSGPSGAPDAAGPQNARPGPPSGQQAPPPGPSGGGYGFPHQQAPGAPGPGGPGGQPGSLFESPGYGVPRQQGPGGPGGPSGGPGTPDWGALAAEAEASGARRRRIMMLVGGIVAVAVIAGGVATAVVVSGGSSDSSAAGSGSSTSATGSQKPLPPEPSFSSVAPPPPANPLDFISSAAKDKAPVTVASLFPGKQFVLAGHTYVKTRTASTSNCSTAAGAPLAGALAGSGCTKLIRATYTNDKIAVTVGIAVFADTSHASKVHNVAHYIAPLNGGGVNDFCHAVACQMTSNSVGRYAYFAIAGFKNGQTLTQGNTTGEQAADDASDFAFKRIIQRGQDAARAQANSQ